MTRTEMFLTALAILGVAMMIYGFTPQRRKTADDSTGETGR